MCKPSDKNIDDITRTVPLSRHIQTYSSNDISIYPYIEIMSSIRIDLIAAGRWKKNRRTNKGTLPTNVAIPPALPGLHPVGIERSHHYTLLRTPLIMPRDRWSTTPFLRTRSRWSELPRSCAAVAKKRISAGGGGWGGERKEPLWRETAVLPGPGREARLRAALSL